MAGKLLKFRFMDRFEDMKIFIGNLAFWDKKPTPKVQEEVW
jgi:hypothetical protein